MNARERFMKARDELLSKDGAAVPGDEYTGAAVRAALAMKKLDANPEDEQALAEGLEGLKQMAALETKAGLSSS